MHDGLIGPFWGKIADTSRLKLVFMSSVKDINDAGTILFHNHGDSVSKRVSPSACKGGFI